MDITPAESTAPTGLQRLTPAAGVRAQLAAAAVVWLVGASILLVRGTGYLFDRYWHAWLLAVAVVLGVLKARVILDRVARKAVVRIHERGRACFFGFFSVKAWVFVIVMMGGGILLRSFDTPRAVLAVVYLGVGTALVLADRIFWQALIAERAGKRPQPTAAD